VSGGVWVAVAPDDKVNRQRAFRAAATDKRHENGETMVLALAVDADHR